MTPGTTGTAPRPAARSIDPSLPPGELLDALLACAADGIRAGPAGHLPWLDGPEDLDDASLSGIMLRALLHAEASGDVGLRQAVFDRAGYRRILAGAPRDPTDPLDLRWDMLHAPAPGTSVLTAILTRRCQLRCTYCVVRLGPEDMAPAVLDRAVELLSTASGDHLRFQLFGGEPLLVPGLVRRAVEGLRRWEREDGRRRTAILITNGLCVDEDLAAFCARYGVGVMLSLDGPPDLTDASRLPLSAAPGFSTYARAARALRMLQAAGATVQVLFTIPPAGAARAAESVEHLLELGVRSLQLCYVMGVPWGEAATRTLCDQLGLVIERHRDALASGELELVNLQRGEPLLLDAAFQVDTDGRLLLSADCLFERAAGGPCCPVARVQDRIELRSLGATPFHDLVLLLRGASARATGIREVVLDNLRLGEAVRDRLQGAPP